MARSNNPIIASALALLLIALPLAAQQPPPRPTPEKTPDKPAQDKPRPRETDPDVIAIDTTEVLLPVTVRDRLTGQFITDLKVEDFTVYEENIPQPISSFTLKRMPVHLVLLVDTSSSVLRELDDFKAAAYNFIAQLDPEDQISLIRFDDKVELVQGWTPNRQKLRRALGRLETGMFTKFYDALWLAANEQLGKIKGRKAIIVLTDGVDSLRGAKTGEQAFRALVESEVPLYVVSKTRIQSRTQQQELSFYEQNASSLNHTRIEGIQMELKVLAESERNLTRMADETGGRIFLPDSFDQLSSAYQQVAEELRSQYVIFYTPTNAARDGKYRAVRVKVNRPNAHAATRFGYYSK